MRGSEQRPRTLALGMWLAARGGLARTALGLAGAGAVVAAILANGHAGPFASHLPTLASMAIAWSAGVSLAFGGALLALKSDVEQGVVALARMRGVDLASYVRGRVWGLTALIAFAVGGATLPVGLVTALASADRLAGAREALAAFAYALAFSVTLGPLAMAALGTGARGVGYVSLAVVIGVPELLASWTAPLLPPGWHELTSIPSALAAVAVGIRGGASLWHVVRALTGLAAVVAASLAVVWARLARAEAGAPS